MKKYLRIDLVSIIVVLGIILVSIPSAYAAPREPIFPPDPTQTAKRYALIVAIADYKDSTGIKDLVYPPADANEWYEQLKYTEDFDTIRVLGDDTSSYTSYYGLATEGNIKSSLAWLRDTAQPEDTVAIIMIGHGDKYAYMECYFKAWDGNYLHDDEFTSYVADIASEKIFIFLDFCRGGGFLDDIQAMPNHQYVFASSACAWDGKSFEGAPYYNGLWTWYYLKEYQRLSSIYNPIEPRQEDVYTGARQNLLADNIDEIALPENQPILYDGNLNHKFLLGDSD